MTVYAVHAQILTHDGPYGGSRQVPTFYLDSRVQGIKDQAHACLIARAVVDPAGTLPVADVVISCYPVDPARESADLDSVAASARMAQAIGRHARLEGPDDAEWLEAMAWAAHRDAERAASGHAASCTGPDAHLAEVQAAIDASVAAGTVPRVHSGAVERVYSGD